MAALPACARSASCPSASAMNTAACTRPGHAASTPHRLVASDAASRLSASTRKARLLRASRPRRLNSVAAASGAATASPAPTSKRDPAVQGFQCDGCEQVVAGTVRHQRGQPAGVVVRADQQGGRAVALRDQLCHRGAVGIVRKTFEVEDQNRGLARRGHGEGLARVVGQLGRCRSGRRTRPPWQRGGRRGSRQTRRHGRGACPA